MIKILNKLPAWILTSLGLILYRILVDNAYENIIAVLFDYQNYLINKSLESLFLSWLFYLSLFPVILKISKSNNFSSQVVFILVLISLVPTSTFIAYHSNYTIEYILLMYLYWFVLLHVNILIPRIKLININSIGSNIVVIAITILLALSILYISYIHTGFRFHINLMTVYDLREESREFEINFFLGYLSTFADNILPIILVYFLIAKKRVLSVFVIIVILMNFGIGGIKQVLFLLLFSLMSYFIVNKNYPTRNYLWFFTFLVCAAIIEYGIFSTWFISLFSLYRIFFIPVKLHYVFYNFFAVNEKDYFRQSALKWLLESPYKENIGFLMGEQDSGSITSRANNGLFSDAFYNFGFLGIILFPIVVIVILKTIEYAAKNLSYKINFILVITITFILINLPFTTALITAGIIPLIFILYFMPRIKHINYL
jgi:hypothetical protein